MRCFGFLFAILLVLAGVAHAGTGPSSAPHLAITLVPETPTPRAGSTIGLALDTRPQPGWHGYWENPGDAGFPARLDWTLPKRVTAAAPRYPVPQTLLAAGLMNHVYEAPYAPLVALTIPPGLRPGTKLPIRLHADYLVCTDSVCVPESADLSTDLVVGDGAVNTATRARFDAWRRALPRPLGAAAAWQRVGDRVRIGVPFPASATLGNAHVFPLTTGIIDNAAPQTFVRDGDRLVIETRAAGGTGALIGVLATGNGTGLTLTATPGNVPPPTAAEHPTPLAGTIATAFLLALLGGLILNIMPCVFPILSLKALSLARGHLDERSAKAEALAYTAGVVLMCLALGGTLLALRAGGTSLGWAFQLQDPRTVLLLALLTFAIGLNLAGLFELPTPGFAGSGGTAGAFATGVLAAFVATPCTGPFMAGALGAALVLPPAAALAIFAGLGIGLALPFLVLGFVPALRRRLPRPGAWMEIFRRILAVPMLLTAIALGWVLGRQAGSDALALALLAALALALVLWSAGARQRRGGAFGPVPAVLLLAVAVLAVVLLPQASAAAPAAGAEPFTEARLATLRAEGRPVFAYFTADWCLTCKVNERVAIETSAAQAHFRRARIAVLVGDWTDGDPALGAFITRHNRAGVPLYLFYPAGGGEPRVLPQVLTPSTLTTL